MVSESADPTFRARASTEDVIAPGQIGWVYFYEGAAEIAAKVIKSEAGELYLALPTVRRAAKTVRIVNYTRRSVWSEKSRALLSFFVQEVGEDFCKTVTPEFPLHERRS